VSHKALKEWAIWVCLWLEKIREDHGLVGQRAALFLDNAPTRRNSEAMHVFPQHNVMVVLFPPHLTHVMQPVDVSWAKPFKTKTAEAWRRYTRSACVVRAAFTELGENIERASQKHRERACMVSSMRRSCGCHQYPMLRNGSAMRAYIHPWGPARPTEIAVH
jgi:hypothetical protein